VKEQKMPKKSKKVMPKPTRLAKVASAIKPEKTHWLCEGRIAIGCVTVIAGEPGLGKSQIAARLAATVSRGGPWPCGEGPAPQGDVVMLVSEDDLAKRTMPLLMAANANLKCVHLIGDHDDPNHKPINLFDDEDLNRLGREVNRTENPKLLIVDPVGAFVDSRMNNGSAARQLIAKLTRGAKRSGIAIVLICHLTKSGGKNALSMIAGSSAIAAAARAVYLVLRGAPGSKWRILACAKNNLGLDNIALRYCIKAEKVDGIDTTRIAWHRDRVQITADEALAKVKANSAKSAQTRAVDELLKGLLADGKRATAEIFAKGEQSGFSPKQLRSAAKRLQVAITNTGFGATKRWFWEAPRVRKSGKLILRYRAVPQ
jgi:putative DNA primase/helicase